MSSVHVLENRQGTQNYRCVLHVTMPTGNNAVGTLWQTCYLTQFLPGAPATVLSVGNGAGQIPQNEANQIASGALIEHEFEITDLPASATQTQRDDNIDAIAASVRATKIAELKDKFKYYGYTRA